MMNNGLELAREKQKRMREQGISVKPLNPLERLEKNPKSLRMAINAQCYLCIGEDYDPHYRWRIGNCEVTYCPLYSVRPHQKHFNTPVPKILKV